MPAPHPPISVGGSSRAAIHRAARFGDAWHPVNPDLDWLRKKHVSHGLGQAAGRQRNEAVTRACTLDLIT